MLEKDIETNNIHEESGRFELLTKERCTPRLALTQARNDSTGHPIRTFSVGFRALLIHVKAIQQAVNWTALVIRRLISLAVCLLLLSKSISQNFPDEF